MKDLLDKISQDNDWANFNDVVYNATHRRTIMQIVEEAIEEQKKPFEAYLEFVRNKKEK